MDQMPSLLLDVSVAMDTDPGRKRKGNQDAIGQMVPTDPEVLARLGQIFVLADGVGGLSGGDLAAQYAVSTIIGSYYEQEEGDPPDRLARAIAEANNVIYAEGQDQDTPRTIATTVVAAVIRGRELIVGSVGDSPAFLMRDASARKLTMDHTVETMRREAGDPLDDGDPTGRKLVRVLGSSPSVKVDIISGPVREGDCIVLCSDGLTRYLTPEEIEQTVATLSPARAVKALIQLANDRGGADNISVIVLRLSGDGALAPDVSPAAADRPAAPAGARVEAASGRVADRMMGATLSGARARRRARELRRQAGGFGDNPLVELWELLRGNTMTTIAALVILLVLFVLVMLLANLGRDDEAASGALPGVTEELLREGDEADEADAADEGEGPTATLQGHAAATAQAQAMLTTDALQVEEANRAATIAALTLTPAPPSGPQMGEKVWFRVLDGDPVPAYSDPRPDAESATPLEPGSAYLVQGVDAEAPNGPWYWVVDNLGAELRWVSGPSLHRRIVAISPSGEPLPDEEQPPDIPPRGVPGGTPEPPPLPAASAGTADSSDATEAVQLAAPTPTGAIPYVAELWDSGVGVVLKEDLALREIPSLGGAELDTATAGETAVITQGPVAADDHWWWRLSFEDGRTGWVAQPLLGYAGD